jgi:hypothetical protein
VVYSPPNRTSCLVYSLLGASSGLDGDPGGTSGDDELEDESFSLHTFLVGEVDVDVDFSDLFFSVSSLSAFFSSDVGVSSLLAISTSLATCPSLGV